MKTTNRLDWEIYTKNGSWFCQYLPTGDRFYAPTREKLMSIINQYEPEED